MLSECGEGVEDGPVVLGLRVWTDGVERPGERVEVRLEDLVSRGGQSEGFQQRIVEVQFEVGGQAELKFEPNQFCLLYTSAAADE